MKVLERKTTLKPRRFIWIRYGEHVWQRRNRELLVSEFTVGLNLHQELRFALVEMNGRCSIMVNWPWTRLGSWGCMQPTLKSNVSFRALKQSIVGFSYHFRSKSMSKLNHLFEKGWGVSAEVGGRTGTYNGTFAWRDMRTRGFDPAMRTAIHLRTEVDFRRNSESIFRKHTGTLPLDSSSLCIQYPGNSC